ncbi:hypothetical protein JCM19232_4975 [Vibrio ishigakensis]|uniref:MSHA biogenesis protein mshG n=1 Tax=Vibrio ishigakensis TaxID=1481914 RepID=A0A0B8PEX0_9VIBR|nr:hypothetical protein JCM19232_4975 [Vibrio ishigakensis]
MAVTATLFKTLSSLTKCGIKLNDALELVHEKNTPFLKWHIETMQSQSIGQSNLGRILDTGLVLPSELNALKILGERVDYYELLTKSSEHHSDYVTAQLKKMQEWLPKAGLIITIVLLGSLISSSAYQIYLDLL